MLKKEDNAPKNALDLIIRKSRVHLYKPIQIAEILYHQRIDKKLDLNDLETYRNISRRWRDEISSRLVGRQSTSSQKYQDNLFEANAVPPKLLVKLGEINQKNKGLVEAYIYRALKSRLSSVHEIEHYINQSTPDNFALIKLVETFQTSAGLRRSVDKMYEILVYALFATIVRALKAKITLEIENNDGEIRRDFARFITMVLGIDKQQTRLVLPATLYRVGVTNAADRGLDIWANFGPAIQVKHLTLKAEDLADIADEIPADKIVIVCLDIERETIETLLTQVGWGERIQGIITINDLDDWYKLCFRKKYRKNLGEKLLQDVGREFAAEFPSSREIEPFWRERQYDKIVFPRGW